MDWRSLLDGLAPITAYLLIATVVGAASALPLGWFVPAQTVALLGGAVASTGELSLVITGAAVYAGALVGCGIGYLLGRALPPAGDRPLRRLWQTRLRESWLSASDALRRHPAGTVLTGRWSAALRACVPNAAGAARLGWWRFNCWNLIACALWAAVVVGIGTLVGRATGLAVAALGVASLLSLAGVIALIAIAYRSRMHHRAHPVIPTCPADKPDGGSFSDDPRPGW